MENQVTTIVCPNCGANTSNLRNCEYCGSFLVQKASVGVDLTNYKIASAQYSNPNVLLAIQKFMDNIKHNPSIDDTLFIENPVTGSTLIMLGNNRADDISKNWNKDGVHVCICFMDDGSPEHGSPSLLMERFKNCSAFPLFNKYSIYENDDRPMSEWEDGETQYYVDFGFDAEGACKLVLQLIDKIYCVNYKDLRCSTNAETTAKDEIKKFISDKSLMWRIIVFTIGIIAFFIFIISLEL